MESVLGQIGDFPSDHLLTTPSEALVTARLDGCLVPPADSKPHEG